MTELFIKYLKGHVGDIYVWGAQGETDITEKWIRRRETGEKNAKRAIALWEKRHRTREHRDPCERIESVRRRAGALSPPSIAAG